MSQDKGTIDLRVCLVVFFFVLFSAFSSHPVNESLHLEASLFGHVKHGQGGASSKKSPREEKPKKEKKKKKKKKETDTFLSFR